MQAVDIRAVERLRRGGYRSGLRLDRLPCADLDVASVNPDDVAILSWRWDIDPPTFTSTNVSIAIEHCVKTGVKYLFFDMVSIDQRLKGRQLMQSVANLAVLYSRFPVIAAYDEIHVPEWVKTMRRPWIAFEARAYAHNPTRVTYVGYMAGQGTEVGINDARFDDAGVLKKDVAFCSFSHMLQRVNDGIYTNTILMLLSNQISMGDLRDFRYLVPQFWRTISLCYSSMTKEDYLLSCAILAQTENNETRINADIEIVDQNFKIYSFRGSEASPLDIYILDKKIGRWRRHYDPSDDDPTLPNVTKRWFEVEADAEALILAAIDAPIGQRMRSIFRRQNKRIWKHVWYLVRQHGWWPIQRKLLKHKVIRHRPEPRPKITVVRVRR